MNEALSPQEYDVAIIGAGAAGVLVAIQLLRLAQGPLRLLLLDPQPWLAQGVAYATTRPEHLLNVPAGKMSGFADAPSDFVDYLLAQPAFSATTAADLAGRYVPRLHYAGYLRERLARACAASPAQLEQRCTRVLAMETEARGACLALAGGASARAAAVVLAVGNALRPLPLRGATGLSAEHRIEAWDSAAVATVPADATVCIIGSGLSMADSVVTLDACGHRGPVHVISRHGLQPLPHADGAPSRFDAQRLLPLSLRRRMRLLRDVVREEAVHGVPWQSVMDRLRPHVQALWCSLDAVDQRRFLRHVVRYWDVHRHRIAQPVYASLQALQASGQLRWHRARLDAAFAAGACVRIDGRDRAGRSLQLDAHRVINATGVEMRVQAMRNPLLQQLLGSGLAQPGPHGIGVDTDADGCLRGADGRADPRIHVLGSLRIGRLWESLAIPELREQARDTAARLWEGFERRQAVETVGRD